MVTLSDKFVSFSSLGKVASIFSGSDEQEKGLVKSVGFGGLLIKISIP